MVFVHIRFALIGLIHVLLVMYFVWWISFLYDLYATRLTIVLRLICYPVICLRWCEYFASRQPPGPWYRGFSGSVGFSWMIWITRPESDHSKQTLGFSLEGSSNQTDPGSVSADTRLVVNKGRANLLAVPRECRTAPAAALQLAFSRVNHC